MQFLILVVWLIVSVQCYVDVTPLDLTEGVSCFPVYHDDSGSAAITVIFDEKPVSLNANLTVARIPNEAFLYDIFSFSLDSAPSELRARASYLKYKLQRKTNMAVRPVAIHTQVVSHSWSGERIDVPVYESSIYCVYLWSVEDESDAEWKAGQDELWRKWKAESKQDESMNIQHQMPEPSVVFSRPPRIRVTNSTGFLPYTTFVDFLCRFPVLLILIYFLTRINQFFGDASCISSQFVWYSLIPSILLTACSQACLYVSNQSSPSDSPSPLLERVMQLTATSSTLHERTLPYLAFRWVSSYNRNAARGNKHPILLAINHMACLVVATGSSNSLTGYTDYVTKWLSVPEYSFSHKLVFGVSFVQMASFSLYWWTFTAGSSTDFSSTHNESHEARIPGYSFLLLCLSILLFVDASTSEFVFKAYDEVLIMPSQPYVEPITPTMLLLRVMSNVVRSPQKILVALWVSSLA